MDSQIPERPVFHPISQRDATAWFPGDDKTSTLIAIPHIYDDILRLKRIHDKCKDSYDKKLLIKYICIELRTLIEVMDKLQAAIFSADTYEPGEKFLYRGISTEERETAKLLWKKYCIAKKQVEDDLINIRNKIGAHRDFSYASEPIEGVTGWHLFMLLWDRLEFDIFENLLESIPPAFNHAKDLNIYEFNHGDESDPNIITFLGGAIY